MYSQVVFSAHKFFPVCPLLATFSAAPEQKSLQLSLFFMVGKSGTTKIGGATGERERTKRYTQNIQAAQGETRVCQ